MKFLTLTSPRGNLPPAVAAAIFQDGKAWLNANLSNGTMDFVHGFPEGGVGVINADSHEDLMEKMRGFPLFPFVDWQVRPLVDIDRSLDSAVEMFKKMAG